MARSFWRSKLRVITGLCTLLLLASSVGISEAASPRGIVLPAKSTGKLSSRLASLAAAPPLSASRTRAVQARQLSLPSEGAGSLMQNQAGEVLTYIRVANTSPATLQSLQAAGARITHVAKAYRTVTAFVGPKALAAIAALGAVENVTEELQPKIARAERQTPTAALRAAAPARADCPTATISEGDQQLQADLARATYGVDGSGITVGVISDSFGQETKLTSPAADVASGDLPGPGNPCGRTTPVNVLRENPVGGENQRPGEDEGRAMAQIVHSLAPGANLAFASAFGGIFDFADAITNLQQQAGASVIVDDISYFIEPFYQDGPITNAINQVTSRGALYFTSAANYNATDPSGNEVGSYEAPSYRPMACPNLTIQFEGQQPQPLSDYVKDCHNFDPSDPNPSSGLVVAAGGSIQLVFQWAEPWYGVTDDFDVFLANTDGDVVAASNRTNNTAKGSQTPFESVSYQNGTGQDEEVYLVIGRASGATAPRMKYIMVTSSGLIGTEYDATVNDVDTFGPTIYGHSAATNAISTAAVPYDDATTPEDFSSRGPAVILYGPVSGETPAARLPAPDVRNKPDVAATDGTQNTFFGQQDYYGSWRFYGTSAAAPHGAAVAALMLQQARARNALLFQTTLNQLLRSTASAMPNGSPTSTGAGLINAAAAVGAANSLPEAKRTFLPLTPRSSAGTQ